MSWKNVLGSYLDPNPNYWFYVTGSGGQSSLGPFYSSIVVANQIQSLMSSVVNCAPYCPPWNKGLPQQIVLWVWI